jgi:hypothetical protein
LGVLIKIYAENIDQFGFDFADKIAFWRFDRRQQGVDDRKKQLVRCCFLVMPLLHEESLSNRRGVH